jgi:hypothetical protein
MGYDQTGCIVLSYRGSADGKLKSEALDPLELIRRWLLNVPQRPHAGASSLSSAAQRACRRVRFLLGLGPYRIPVPIASEPLRCPHCKGTSRPWREVSTRTRPALVPRPSLHAHVE